MAIERLTMKKRPQTSVFGVQNKTRSNQVRLFLAKLNKQRLIHSAYQSATYTRGKMKIVCSFVSFSLFLTALLLITACGSDSGTGYDAADPYRIVTDNYELPAGSTLEIDEDLVIIASESVSILGELKARGDKGQSITIESAGDVYVAGLIQSGAGAAGQEGGDISITTASGDIILEAQAKIKAGDGGDAESASDDSNDLLNSSTNEAGQNGASVILAAAQGVIYIPDVAGVIQIGNGGDGLDINIPCPTYAAGELPEEFNNFGGNSGGMRIEADRLEGLVHEKEVLTEDWIDPDTGQVILEAGETLYILEETDQISGGVGGSPGRVLYGVDENGEPVDCSDSSYASSWNEDYDPEVPEVITRKGIPGGSGMTAGGKGQSLFGRQAEAADGYGQTPKGIEIRGGQGGDCGKIGLYVSFNASFQNCQPGQGGSATAYGGQGGDGANPSQNGGWGGSAIAVGGPGGTLYTGRTSIKYEGRGGDAYAYGGRGGKGGGLCPDWVEDVGGEGGFGGGASAYEGNWEYADAKHGSALASSGAGGTGGDGREKGGAGGLGGTADAISATDAKEIQGTEGATGSICPVTPSGKLIIAPKEVAVVTGKTEQFKAYHATETGDQDVTDQAAWTSSTADVATVDKGVVECKGDGSTTIKAAITKPNEVSYSGDATVNCGSRGFKITPTRVTASSGETLELTAIVEKDDVNHNMTDYSDWASLDESVVVITGKGLGVCQAAGETQIRASFYDQLSDKTYTSSASVGCK